MAKKNYTKEQLEKLSVEQLRHILGKIKTEPNLMDRNTNSCDCAYDNNCMPGYMCEIGYGNCDGESPVLGVCVPDYTGYSGDIATPYGSALLFSGGDRNRDCPDTPNCTDYPIEYCCPNIERNCACFCYTPEGAMGRCISTTPGFGIPGCTYEGACNYNIYATENDGSCDFANPANCDYCAGSPDNGTGYVVEGDGPDLCGNCYTFAGDACLEQNGDTHCDSCGVCNGPCIDLDCDFCGRCENEADYGDPSYECPDGSSACTAQDCRCVFEFVNPYNGYKISTNDLIGTHPITNDEYHGLIDCSGQCVAPDYRTILELWENSCGMFDYSTHNEGQGNYELDYDECDRRMHFWFDGNSKNGYTFYDRATECSGDCPGLSPSLIQDGVCHCGDDDCLNNNGSTGWSVEPPDGLTIPGDTYDTLACNDCYDMVYPDFNCDAFNFDKIDDTWNPDTGFTYDCLLHNSAREDEIGWDTQHRDKFKFHVINDKPIHYLNPYNPIAFDYKPIEIFDKAINPIDIELPLQSPTKCGCGFTNYIWNNNFSDAMEIVLSEACSGWDSSLISALGCKILAYHFGFQEGFWETLNDRRVALPPPPELSYLQLSDYPVYVADYIGLQMSIVYNNTMAPLGANAAGLGQGLGSMFSTGRDLELLIEEYMRLNGFGDFDVSNKLDAIGPVLDIFALDSGNPNPHNTTLPIHLHTDDYLINPQTEEPNTFSPYSIVDWRVESTGDCHEDAAWGGTTSFYQECSYGEDTFFQDVSDFFSQSWSEWFGDTIEKREVSGAGTMKWYHESTPYKTGKTATGTVGIDYEGNYNRLGPYSSETPVTSNELIERVGELNHIDVNSIDVSENQSNLGLIEFGSRFSISQYPYNYQIFKETIGEYPDMDIDLGWWDPLDPGFFRNILDPLSVFGVYGGGYDESNDYNLSLQISDGVGSDNQCLPENHSNKVCQGDNYDKCDCNQISGDEWKNDGEYGACGEMWDCGLLGWDNFGRPCDCTCHCPNGHVSNSLGYDYFRTKTCNRDCKWYCIDNGHMEPAAGTECEKALNNCGCPYEGAPKEECITCAVGTTEEMCNDYTSESEDCLGCRYEQPQQDEMIECWTNDCILEGAANYNPEANMGTENCQFLEEYPYDLYTSAIEAFKRFSIEIEVDDDLDTPVQNINEIKLVQRESDFHWAANRDVTVFDDRALTNTDGTLQEPKHDGSKFIGQNLGADTDIYYNHLTSGIDFKPVALSEPYQSYTTLFEGTGFEYEIGSSNLSKTQPHRSDDSDKLKEIFTRNARLDENNYGGIWFDKVQREPQVNGRKVLECFEYLGDQVIFVEDSLTYMELTTDWIGENLDDEDLQQDVVEALYGEMGLGICDIYNSQIDGQYVYDIQELSLGNAFGQYSFNCTVEELCSEEYFLPAIDEDIFIDFRGNHKSKGHMGPVRYLEEVSDRLGVTTHYHPLFWDLIGDYWNNPSEAGLFDKFDNFVMIIRYLHDAIYTTGDKIKEFDILNEYLLGGPTHHYTSKRFDYIVEYIQNEFDWDAERIAEEVNNHRFFTYNLAVHVNEEEDEDDIVVPPISIPGCMDSDACNYNPEADIDPFNECIFPEDYFNVCYGDLDNDTEYDDVEYFNFCPIGSNDFGYTDNEQTCEDMEGDYYSEPTGQMFGCTDAMACNFEVYALTDDGTCEYGPMGDGINEAGYHCGDINYFRKWPSLNNACITITGYDDSGKPNNHTTECGAWDDNNRLLELNLDNHPNNNLDEEKFPLTGEWPEKDDLHQWEYLTYLNLQFQVISGKIPYLSYPLMFSLYLSENKFEGEFNPGTMNQNLKKLHLSFNELSSLHESVSILTNLEELHLQDNLFTGPVPTFLMNLTNLTYLGVADNEFTSLPQNIGDLQQLEILFASRNNITLLPDSIGDILTLKSLQMGLNKLTTLPETLANLQNAPLGEGSGNPLTALNFYGNLIDSIPDNICPALDERIALIGNNLCEEYHLDCLDSYPVSEYEWDNATLFQDCKKVRNVGDVISPSAESNVLRRHLERKLDLGLTDIGGEETPFSEDPLLQRTFTPEFKFKASHFKNQKFLPMIIKMAVDISDYYRENYWGGKPHRFYMNEFQILNNSLLEQEFPHRDEHLMSDFANYVDTLKSLKPGSSAEYPSTICNPDGKCVYTWDDIDGEEESTSISCTETCDCNHPNPPIPSELEENGEYELENTCNQVSANKRYRDMELDSYYYYDRLGIGLQGHIWTNGQFEKTSLYDGIVPGEYRSSVIFDRFGGYIWSVLEKLTIASDRRLPIQINELDFYEENYCKRFETIGMTRGENDDGTENETFDSHFNSNHPEYRICQKHNEMTANGGKGNHLFGKRNADDTDWEETPEDQAARYGLNFEYLDNCDGYPYREENDDEQFVRITDKNNQFVHRLNHESNYGNIDTLYELKAYHLTNLYYKLYSHPNVVGVTAWNWFGSSGNNGALAGMRSFGHRFTEHPLTGEWMMPQELDVKYDYDLDDWVDIEPGANSWWGLSEPSATCHNSLVQRYSFVEVDLDQPGLISDKFSQIGTINSPMISILDWRSTVDFELLPMKSAEAHKAFVSQHDWIGETNMSVLTNGSAEHVRVPFGKYDIYVLESNVGPIDDNQRTPDVTNEYIHYGTINIPIEASGVFNQDIRTTSQPIEDYIEVNGKLEVVSMSNQDDKNIYTPQGLNIKLRIKP